MSRRRYLNPATAAGRNGARTAAWPSLILALLGLGILTACTRHTVHVQPVEVKPIHVTMDINLKVQNELDRFFKSVEQAPATGKNGDSTEKPSPEPSKEPEPKEAP